MTDQIEFNVWNKWDPLKTCIIGSSVNPDYFEHVKNKELKDKLTKMLIETQEDMNYFADVLRQHQVHVIQEQYNPNDRLHPDIKADRRHMINLYPRDRAAVLGNQFVFDNAVTARQMHKYTGKTINDSRKEPWAKLMKVNGAEYNLYMASWTMVGTDLFIDAHDILTGFTGKDKIINWVEQYIPGTKVHWLEIGGHTDGTFHTCKPGVIISLYDIQKYEETFPNWDVLYLPDQHMHNQGVKKWSRIQKHNKGKWWMPGEENNKQMTEFVNTWLDEWLGYVEETVFDINIIMINERTACVTGYHKEVFDYFKKHKIEPIIVPLRHRYFWDGGLHCSSCDINRTGDQQSYINYT